MSQPQDNHQIIVYSDESNMGSGNGNNGKSALALVAPLNEQREMGLVA